MQSRKYDEQPCLPAPRIEPSFHVLVGERKLTVRLNDPSSHDTSKVRLGTHASAAGVWMWLFGRRG